jgi:hypothetical protein
MGQSLRDTHQYARLVGTSLDVGQGAYDKPVVAGLLVASHWLRQSQGACFPEGRSPVVASRRHKPNNKPPFWCQPPLSLNQEEITPFVLWMEKAGRVAARRMLSLEVNK